MKLTGVRTIIHIEDMNDAEKIFLQDSDSSLFLQDVRSVLVMSGVFLIL